MLDYPDIQLKIKNELGILLLFYWVIRIQKLNINFINNQYSNYKKNPTNLHLALTINTALSSILHRATTNINDKNRGAI